MVSREALMGFAQEQRRDAVLSAMIDPMVRPQDAERGGERIGAHGGGARTDTEARLCSAGRWRCGSIRWLTA
jgi:hypothetical protein